MMKYEEVQDQAVQVLTGTLSNVPFIETVEVKRGVETEFSGTDLVINVISPDGDVVILVEVKTSGEPRLAREAVNQLLRSKADDANSYTVFVAPYISAQAAKVCREANVGYMDLAGNCLLSFGRVYIERQGYPKPAVERRGLRTLYSPKATRVLRVLLENPHRQWKLQTLAEEAQVSIGQVHKVKTLLADREWILSEQDGVSLSKPGDLLTEWAENYQYRRNTIREYHSLKPLREIESGIAAVCGGQGLRYALAAFSAAARLAPFVRYQRASVYVTEDALPDIVRELNLKQVSSGANVMLWIPYDEGVFYGAKELESISATSPIQTYLDVRNMPGRGEEAAEFLRAEVIEPKW